MTDLEQAIRRQLPAALFDALPTDSAEYHAKFRTSGKAKAETVLQKLHAAGVDFERTAFFSLGGSFGTEIISVMEQSSISRGVLLEYDPLVAETVHEEKRRLKALGKHLHFVNGDATQQIGACRRTLRSWHEAGLIDTVVCSANAVFHEIPSRSPKFRLNNFLHQMLDGWRRTIFICREPCAPIGFGWNGRVELSIPAISPEVLEELAKEIQRHVHLNGEVVRVAKNWVEMSSVLAIETLVKIFYIKDLRHELQERITELNAESFARELGQHFQQNAVTLLASNSESFEAHYRALKVSAQKRGLAPLPIPVTFCKFFADSGGDAPMRRPVIEVTTIEPPPAVAPAPMLHPAPSRPSPDRRTQRFLRRRCRVMIDGSEKFQRITRSLLSHEYDYQASTVAFFDEWNSLEDDYERTMALGAFYEATGDIETMRDALREVPLRRSKEGALQLYLAIAEEKLDNVPAAQKILQKILSSESRMDIVRAAQFNLSVCYEKQRRYNDVRFADFISDTETVFLDRERRCDKAVAMQLIVSLGTGKQFMYQKELRESLRFLLSRSRTGYVKTLLTRMEYDRTSPPREVVDEILADLTYMDANSRVSILMTLSKYSADDSLDLPARIAALIREWRIPDATVAKWIQPDALRRP